MDIGYLVNCIRDSHIPLSEVAKALGKSRQALYAKMAGDVDFKVSEIDTLCDFLRLTNDERKRIFFANEVDEK